MKMMLSLVFVPLATACMADATDAPLGTSNIAARDITIDPATDLVESGFVNGALCNMIFPGGLTPQTQTYQIWSVGTHGIVNAPYNTLLRPNLYAVFGTSTTASLVHHVDGFSQFDHYHILDNLLGTDVDNTTWDLLVLFPGPNYNAATYQPARSVAEMLLQSTLGILSPVMTLPEAGFPPVVLNMPVQCPGH
jgi:hypothetical protein